jgi:hypothetical protein
MKFRTRIHLAVCLQILVLMITPCLSAPGAGCEVAVAALNLPGNTTGEVHWRAAADTATSPLQLSTRYFSQHLKVTGHIIRFYENPVTAGQTDPLPEPFLTLKIPPDTKLAYVVIRSKSGKNSQSQWHGTLLRGNEWRAGCLRVHNACPEVIGMSAGSKRFKLPRGKSKDFNSNQWRKSFPVKIYQLQPKQKLMFSSTWRVAPGRRELCFIGKVGNSVKIRSLIAFKKPPPKKVN